MASVAFEGPSDDLKPVAKEEPFESPSGAIRRGGAEQVPEATEPGQDVAAVWAEKAVLAQRRAEEQLAECREETITAQKGPRP